MQTIEGPCSTAEHIWYVPHVVCGTRGDIGLVLDDPCESKRRIGIEHAHYAVESNSIVSKPVNAHVDNICLSLWSGVVLSRLEEIGVEEHGCPWPYFAQVLYVSKSINVLGQRRQKSVAIPVPCDYIRTCTVGEEATGCC